MTVMRAAVLRQHGRPPEYGSHPSPRRGPGEALIRVTAAPVNPLDLLCASGTSYFGPPALPYVPGAQGTGTVAGADGLPAGQRVWFSSTAGMRPGDGAMAELCVVPEAATNMLSGEQRARAMREVLTHAAAGRLTTDLEIMPLEKAAEGWSSCGQAPHRRAVLVP